METGAERGHTGEEAWTIMTMDGAECMSSGVHILGFFVGHMGYNSHKRTTNEKRKGYADYDLETKTLLPCCMTSTEDGGVSEGGLVCTCRPAPPDA